MAIEIERKFLINPILWKDVEKGEGFFYRQGYLTEDALKAIRVRLTPQAAFITIKGLLEGINRLEYEYEIPQNEAEEILNHFATSELTKTRYCIPFHEHVWEVDVFHGENEGLIVAEIELTSEEEEFEKPEWLDKEVSEDERYYNVYLARKPFKSW